jgi:hypothetical protein
MNLAISETFVIIPAKAGIQVPGPQRLPPVQARGRHRTPAFAGVTVNVLV